MKTNLFILTKHTYLKPYLSYVFIHFKLNEYHMRVYPSVILLTANFTVYCSTIYASL